MVVLFWWVVDRWLKKMLGELLMIGLLLWFGSGYVVGLFRCVVGLLFMFKFL